MISIENITVEFGVKPLFRNVSFIINDNDRIALVGKNGAGKSTMLKIINGSQKPTEGVVATSSGLSIGYLPQVMILQDNNTVKEEAKKAFDSIIAMKKHIDALNEEVAKRTDYESPEYAKLLETFTLEHERYLMLGGDNYESEIDRTLIGLGFTHKDFDRPTTEFSGGWRMRIERAKNHLRHPDVLLLDEPTNHLDIESIGWLERFLQQSGKAVLLVSHD
uniref:ATP-binding cassette domain-containing protein n=1 Tax=Prevotella sp. TaxID=59823 RepID=UPI003FEDCC55